jgi:hypothetical protein
MKWLLNQERVIYVTVIRGHVVVLVALAWMATGAWAVTRTVPAQYATIQAAVDACIDGDVVVVSPGNYPDFRFNGKAIIVRSTNPLNAATVNATVLDGSLHLTENLVAFVNGEGRHSILDGFRITNGEIGVVCDGASPIIRNCVIEGTDALGVAVRTAGAPLFLNNRIQDTGLTGGIICSGTSTPVIRGNRVIDARGIDCGANCRPIIEDNLIANNTGVIPSGIRCYGGVIRRNEIRNNAGFNGGIACYGNTTVCYNLIVGNTANDAGGGIWCSGDAKLFSNTICDNTSPTSEGGNICVATGSPIIKNNIIAYAHAGGGIVNLGTGTPKVTYCSFYSNVGANYSGQMTVGPGIVIANPRLNRASAGVGDYRLKSKYGRWTDSGWVLDTVQSSCIDKGDPASAYAAEPAPNGGRINLGYDGNTVRASKSASGGAPALAQSITAAGAGTTGGGAQLTVSLSSAANVQVTIANIAGRTVAALPSSDLPAGVSTLLWNGQSGSGCKVPAGSYVARLTARGEDGGQAQALAMLTVRR